MYFEVHILVIWNNHEYGVLMNYKVKCVENLSRNNECMHMKCNFFVIIVGNNFARFKFHFYHSPLLSDFSTLSNEVNTWKVVSPILSIVVLVSWSLEGTNLHYLVICFVTLGSSKFGYSCGTSKICLLDVLVVHLLGDAPPPFDLSILCLGFYDAPFRHCLL
jgi:hypothetical protein